MYPLRLIRPNNRYKYDVQDQIKKVVDEINESSSIISDLIADNPKRSDIRCALCHGATYACEYCEAKAVLVQSIAIESERTAIQKKYALLKKNIENNIEFLNESPGSVKAKERDAKKIAELKEHIANLETEKEKELKSISKRKQLVWPFSTMSAILRTVDLIKYTVEKIKRNPELDKHEKKGIKGESHLLNQPNFNFIKNIPAEYMHLGCLGTVKRLLELTYDSGEKREKLSKRKLSPTILYNRQMKKIKVVREFGRRCRNLDLSLFKAQEYRNVILFFYPIVVDSIEDNYPKEKKNWLYLAYIMRAGVLPNKEFDEVEKNDIKIACRKYFSLFEQCFGQKNCSYSIHVFASHLLTIRGDKPFTERSAFVFESFYAEMKNLFHPGTSSPLKQILSNTLMKREMETHFCNKPIKYDCEKSNVLENNSMIYIFNEKKEHEFYNIVKKNDDNSYQCTQQGRFPYKCSLTQELNWSLVGVYNIGPSNSTEINIKESDIDGKIIKVKNILITCPVNVLNEQ